MATATQKKRALPRPKTGRGEQTRQKILDAAKREIGRHGFAETSIAAITTEAGVAQGTFYIYFRTKEDVLRELVLHMGRTLRHHLTEAIAGARNRMEAERLGLVAFLEFVRRNPDLYQVVDVSQFVDPKIYRQYYLDFVAGYCEVLNEAEQRNEIAPGGGRQATEIRAWMLMGMADFLGKRYGLWDTKTPLGPVVDDAMAMIANGIAIKPR